MDYIKKAIAAGKILPDREGHYRRLMARNPVATKRLLDRLHPVPGLAATQPANTTRRGPIASSAGLPVAPHPSGGFYVVEELS
jgi:phage I-like protein